MCSRGLKHLTEWSGYSDFPNNNFINNRLSNKGHTMLKGKKNKEGKHRSDCF